MTKLRVLVLCFSYSTVDSNVSVIFIFQFSEIALSNQKIDECILKENREFLSDYSFLFFELENVQDFFRKIKLKNQ